MNLSWFTLDWGKRWGLPVCVLAVGVGSFVGAVQYRYLDAPRGSTVAFAPATTATMTVTETAAPVVNTVTRAEAPRVETVVKTPEAAVATRTRTVEAPATPKPAETKTETVTATATKTETERVLQVVEKDSNGKGQG